MRIEIWYWTSNDRDSIFLFTLSLVFVALTLVFEKWDWILYDLCPMSCVCACFDIHLRSWPYILRIKIWDWRLYYWDSIFFFCTEYCDGIYFLDPDPWFWELRFEIEYYMALPWVLCLYLLKYTTLVLTIIFENWDLRFNAIWSWLFFIGP